MIRAIVYTSNTGSTAAYAKLLGEQINLPVFPLPQAKDRVPSGSEIIYLGWIMAGGVKGYKAAGKRSVRWVWAVLGRSWTRCGRKTTFPKIRRFLHSKEDWSAKSSAEYMAL